MENLLGQAGWKRNEIAAVGFIDGPGSFTGLRIGLSTALGLEAALKDLRLVAVGTFQALSESLRDRHTPLLCIEDARIGVFYAALYSATGQPDPVLPEAVYPAERIQSELKPGRLLAGRAWKSRNGEIFGHRSPDLETPAIEALARIVADRISRGEFTPANEVRPRYYGVSPVGP